MKVNEYLIKEINDLSRKIGKEKEELKKTLLVNNPTQYTNLNSNYLVYMQGKMEALETLLYKINIDDLE